MKIDRTLIGTNNVPTITNGVPLYKDVHFPMGWSTNFAKTWWDTGKNFHIMILHGKVRTRFAGNIELGLAGPEWAGRMEVYGSSDKKQIKLNIQEDDFRTGMLIGVNFNFQFALELQTYTLKPHVSWRHGVHFTKEWKTLANIEKDMNFGLLDTIVWVASKVKSALENIPYLKDVLTFIPQASLTMVANGKGIVEHIDKPDSKLDWIWEGLVMSPNVKIKWDLAEVIEMIVITVGEATPLDPIIAVLDEFSTLTGSRGIGLKPSLVTGPVFEAEFGTHLKISDLVGYSKGSVVKTKNLRAEGSYLVGDIKSGEDKAESIDELGISITHRASIDFGAGWFMTISWLKIINLTKVKIFDLKDLIGIDIPASEQYKYELKNRIGNVKNESDIEIIFEDSWVFNE
jgi:hypothetical protein